MSRVLRVLGQRRTAYLPLGLILLGAAGLALGFGPGARRLVAEFRPDADFAYAFATGILLLGSIAVQWRLYLARRSRDGRRIRREYLVHRWAGIGPLALLILHMGGPQATLMSVMGYALLGSSFAGLFNQEILPIRAEKGRALWLAIHVGLAAFIIPLALVHAWAVLAFRVN